MIRRGCLGSGFLLSLLCLLLEGDFPDMDSNELEGNQERAFVTEIWTLSKEQKYCQRP